MTIIELLCWPLKSVFIYYCLSCTNFFLFIFLEIMEIVVLMLMETMKLTKRECDARTMQRHLKLRLALLRKFLCMRLQMHYAGRKQRISKKLLEFLISY